MYYQSYCIRMRPSIHRNDVYRTLLIELYISRIANVGVYMYRERYTYRYLYKQVHSTISYSITFFSQDDVALFIHYNITFRISHSILLSKSIKQYPNTSACKASIFHVATSFANIDQFGGLWDKVQHLQAKHSRGGGWANKMHIQFIKWGKPLWDGHISGKKTYSLCQCKGGTSHTSSPATLFPGLFWNQAIM